MNNSSKAKIFLSSERGHVENEWLRSYSIFNFGMYQHEHKNPFGDLYVLNDDTLAGKRSLKLEVEEESCLFILPVVGTVIYKDDCGNEADIESGQIYSSALAKGNWFEITNPYEEELVNYLQIWLKLKNGIANQPILSFFDLSQKNSLHKIAATGKANFYIGKYDGRMNEVFKASDDKSLFVFIIQGAFEVQNRLLEARDALTLTGVDELEFEALSNDAILLLLEIAPTEL